MTIRKLILSAAALGVLGAAPALAQDGPPAGEGGPGPMMDKKMNADTDGDGFLSKAEFLAVHEKRFGEMDKDSDGKISKDEMKSHHETMKERMKERRKEWADKRKEKMEEKTESAE